MIAENLKELQAAFVQFRERVEVRYNELNLLSEEKSLEELKTKLEDPGLWEDEKRISEAKEIQMKLAAGERKLEGWKSLRSEISDLVEYVDIALMEGEEEMFRDLFSKAEALDKRYEELDLESMLSGPDDMRNAFLNIHPGAGGTESQDWADMLHRAYLRWAEKKGYSIETVDYLEGEEAGIKNVTLLIKGTNAYGFLKAENGVHRLVRISPFDSNKRRHTSFASVHVSPEISDDVEIEILEKDLRIDTYRASGAGGQHVNKTDSAVRITHEPTGIVVACQNERSQIKNRSTAMKLLKARLYELAQEQKQAELDAKSGERKDISWGNQIRSYVFHPYTLVKDLRTGYEVGNVQGVMDGDFDPFIDSYLRKLSSGAAG